MRLALILLLTACAPSEPEQEIICTTHSIEETGGGLTECFEAPKTD